MSVVDRSRRLELHFYHSAIRFSSFVDDRTLGYRLSRRIPGIEFWDFLSKEPKEQ
jgi:hypothetical protein